MLVDAQLFGLAVPAAMYPCDLSVDRGISAEVRAVLEAEGQALRVRPAWSMGSNFASAVDHGYGVLAAGVDPVRRGSPGRSEESPSVAG